MRATLDVVNKSSNRLSIQFFAGLMAGAIFSATVFSLIFLVVLFSVAIPSSSAMITAPLTNVSNLNLADISGVNASDKKQRPIGDIRRDVKAYVKNSKQTSDLNLQVGAVVDLCMIHREIVFDARYSTHQQLQNLRAQVATRLKNYRDELQVTMKRRKREAAKATSSPNDETDRFVLDDAEPATPESTVTRSDEDAIDDQFMTDAMSASMYSMGKVTGGPSQVFGYLSGNFAPPWDYSDELIDLIETTINPDFWRSNGGDGTIRYYDPSQILVVSASAQVHDQLTDMLRMMRFLQW